MTLGITDSVAAIKLMAGCIQQLRQAAQLQEPDVPKCCTCQKLQSFLKHPEQMQMLVLGEKKQAQHGIQ